MSFLANRILKKNKYKEKYKHDKDENSKINYKTYIKPCIYKNLNENKTEFYCNAPYLYDFEKMKNIIINDMKTEKYNLSISHKNYREIHIKNLNMS